MLIIADLFNHGDIDKIVNIKNEIDRKESKKKEVT